VTLDIRFVEKKRQTLVRIVPEGRRYGLTVPLGQIEDFLCGATDEANEQIGQITIRTAQGGVAIRYRNGRPLKMTLGEFKDLTEQLSKQLYWTLPFAPAPDRRVLITIPRPLGWILWETNNGFKLTNPHKTSYITITAYRSGSDAILPQVIYPDKRRERIIRDSAGRMIRARRVGRNRRTGNMTRGTVSRFSPKNGVGPDLIVETAAWSVPREAKRTAALQDKIVRQMETIF
jgi:hypothetical protein